MSTSTPYITAQGLEERFGQTLTTAQKLQACNNLGDGDPETDFVAAYNTAKS